MGGFTGGGKIWVSGVSWKGDVSGNDDWRQGGHGVVCVSLGMKSPLWSRPRYWPILLPQVESIPGKR